MGKSSKLPKIIKQVALPSTNWREAVLKVETPPVGLKTCQYCHHAYHPTYFKDNKCLECYYESLPEEEADSIPPSRSIFRGLND